MRLFLAVFPSKEIIKHFLAIQGSLKKYQRYIRFIPREQIHMTIRFLGGEVSEESYNKIVIFLNEFDWNIHPINFRFDEVKFGFPGIKKPRILYISIKRNQQLDIIISEISKRIRELGLQDIQDMKYESPTFHYTLGRRKTTFRKMLFKVYAMI